MYKKLRILSSVLAAACAAVTIFIFVFFGIWGFIPLCGAVLFAALMFLFKSLQEKEEQKLNPPPAEGDFITGKVEKPKEDEK